jgi:hypothetical protein
MWLVEEDNGMGKVEETEWGKSREGRMERDKGTKWRDGLGWQGTHVGLVDEVKRMRLVFFLENANTIVVGALETRRERREVDSQGNGSVAAAVESSARETKPSSSYSNSACKTIATTRQKRRARWKRYRRTIEDLLRVPASWGLGTVQVRFCA